MFIEQAYRGKHDFWLYLVGSLIVAIAAVIGQIPLTLAIFLENGLDSVGMSQPELMQSLDPNLLIFLLLLSFAIGLVGLKLAVKYLHQISLMTITTTRKKVDWGRIILGFGLIAVFSSISIWIDYQSNPENYVWNYKSMPFLILCLIAIVMVPIQTSLEEYLFRGYLMQGFGMGTRHKYFSVGLIVTLLIALVLFGANFMYDIDLLMNAVISFAALVTLVFIHMLLEKKNVYGKAAYLKFNTSFQFKFTPLIITSLIFGLLHLANPEVEKLGYSILFFYIGTGLFLGIITLMDEGMELALGFHAGNNLIGIILVTANWTAFQSESLLKDVAEPTIGFDVFLPLLIVYPIFYIIMAKVYKWKNWKEKLFGAIKPPVETRIPN
ncbi:CPBP family glutamic-type intramembrane protease [Mesonia sp. MT50]|uniref:CPBP family glutamic-type intramembrane protease n=1 Tax=Mesonia profundi TaxID=3070998 RepID=A0ABU0ZZT7_9FLAO|nr:CPBP family glutamic-type intramembrane protease [Mesonia profundi]MDQ7916969.1 CPBP family glutamic-type intramembrane protease [Mesonia profundi]